MNPTRRGFLGLLPALVVGTTTYFDVGASWQRHGDLWFPVRQFGVDVQFSSQDLALTIQEFSERFIPPAIALIVNEIDKQLPEDAQWRLNRGTRWE